MNKKIILDGEEWNYLIYDDGRVFSLSTNKFLNPDTSSGYCRYMLCKNKKHKRVPAHTLVGLHFIDNPNGLPIIHHKDGNRLNNHVDNLEWMSYSDNVKAENCIKHEKIERSFSDEELTTEVWKPYRDGRYEASSLGRLRNVDSGAILVGHINPVLTYIRDNLFFRGGAKLTVPRHRIVYEAFHPDEELKVINHIDGDKANNRLSNLENVTQSENNKKAYTETKTRKTRKCLGTNIETGESRVFFSIMDAAKFIGCNECTIRHAVNDGRKTHGYIWKNLTDEEYNQILNGSETTESIVEKKDLNE